MEDIEAAQPAPALRKIIHDLNGELFLIRGYIELTVQGAEKGTVAHTNMVKALERLDELEVVIGRLRNRNRIVEADR